MNTVSRFSRCISLVTVAALVACGGGGGGGGTSVPPPTTTATPVATTPPHATATPVATATPTSGVTAAFTCPTSDAPTFVARAGEAFPGDGARHGVAHVARNAGDSASRIAVTYDRSTALRAASTIAAREASVGARLTSAFDFTHTGVTMHVLAVPAAKQSAIEAALRAMPGVRSVAATGQRRHATTVNAPYYPNDPYFNGFGPAEHVGPYDETATLPGQWDMHATRLEYAFAYSQSGNGSGITNAAALGSSGVHVAIVDTGEDTTHPELHTKIARQRCFITDTSNRQSTSSFTTDPFGHGTDVSGIAAADTGNAFGFAGEGGNVTLYGYRVFPTPDDNCTNDNNNDPQCGADTDDIASAIEDAVTSHAAVISMSLGGDYCTTPGSDPDPVEGGAIADAISAGVVVVAAAGNDGMPGSPQPLEAPACDSGVIAVGASALDDGQLNGTNSGRGTAANPIEYVAYYSNIGSPAASPKSASAWGIVAPGGDPGDNGNDNDELHWVENIWTSTPYMSSPSDTNYEGECTDDYPNSTGTTPPVDCRVLIAGTSMATPHVAGAAALIISVDPTYANPAKMKQLLCTTADDINDPDEGCGRLNIYRAMAVALGDPHLP